MRILILTQWFEPEPAFKGLSFAKELQRLGHQVEVITGFPNYPGGKLYQGYNLSLYKKERIDGVSVIRVPLYPSHDSSPLKRILNYLSFAFSAATIGSVLASSADVLYVYHPPATVGFAAIAIKLFRRIPFVYDIQDLWPDTLHTTGMVKKGFILKATGFFCRFVYTQASALSVLSPGFKTRLIERGVPERKINIIYNWTDEESYNAEMQKPISKTRIGFNNKFNVVFAGNMGKAQSLDVVLKAAEKLQNLYPKIQFVFIGDGVEVVRLKRIKKEKKIRNVCFIDRVSKSKIGYYLSLSDVLVVHLKKDPLFKITIPSKVQSYMKAGKPILLGGEGDVADLVNNSGCGVVCVPGCSNSLAEGVVQLFEMSELQRIQMGNCGKKFYDDNLSFSIGIAATLQVFNSIFSKKWKTR